MLSVMPLHVRSFLLAFTTGAFWALLRSVDGTTQVRFTSHRHGGQAISLFLHQHLHGLFESVDKSQIPELYAWMKELGGYFKRFRGGVLQPWIAQPACQNELDLEARATLAFLSVKISLTFLLSASSPYSDCQADRIVSEGHESKSCGATASVALLHSLDAPATPFFSAKQVALTVAHVG